MKHKEEADYSPIHITTARVRKKHVDGYEHANYLDGHPKLLEVGRNDFLDSKGVGYSTLWDEFGLKIFVVKMNVDYHAQLKLGDQVSIHTCVHVKGGFLYFDQQMYKGENRTTDGLLLMLAVNSKDTPQRVPVPLRERLMQ